MFFDVTHNYLSLIQAPVSNLEPIKHSWSLFFYIIQFVIVFLSFSSFISKAIAKD